MLRNVYLCKGIPNVIVEWVLQVSMMNPHRAVSCVIRDKFEIVIKSSNMALI